MNFEFSEEQLFIRDQARNFLSQESTAEVVRSVLDGEQPYHRELWQQIVDLGWTAVVDLDNMGSAAHIPKHLVEPIAMSDPAYGPVVVDDYLTFYEAVANGLHVLLVAAVPVVGLQALDGLDTLAVWCIAKILKTYFPLKTNHQYCLFHHLIHRTLNE